MSKQLDGRNSTGWLNSLARLLAVAVVLSISMACTPNTLPMAGSPAKEDRSLSPKQPETPVQSVQIVVHLDVPGVDQYREEAARTKDPEAVKRLDRRMAQEIAIVADRVLRQIEPTGAALIHRYRTLPLVTLRATPAAVAKLKSMPEVLEIEVDHAVPPSR